MKFVIPNIKHTKLCLISKLFHEISQYKHQTYQFIMFDIFTLTPQIQPGNSYIVKFE